MNDAPHVRMTKQGLEELKNELSELTDSKRPAIVERLSEARKLGDLSENSEYAAAKDELTFIDGRISELEDIIRSAQVVETKSKTSIDVGSMVTVHVNGKKEDFSLVGEWEADPTEKKISHSSPLGKALIGKKVGEKIEVEAPAGKINYKILKIS